MKENVKVTTTILNKVRKHCQKTRQTVGGYYDLAVQEKLARDNQVYQTIIEDPLMRSKSPKNNKR